MSIYDDWSPHIDAEPAKEAIKKQNSYLDGLLYLLIILFRWVVKKPVEIILSMAAGMAMIFAISFSIVGLQALLDGNPTIYEPFLVVQLFGFSVASCFTIWLALSAGVNNSRLLDLEARAIAADIFLIEENWKTHLSVLQEEIKDRSTIDELFYNMNHQRKDGQSAIEFDKKVAKELRKYLVKEVFAAKSK